MRLHVAPMDSVIVDVSDDGQVRFENEEAWSTPTLQEQRAIIYAATNEIAALQELIEKLQDYRITGLQEDK